jgi:hypothetical protein
MFAEMTRRQDQIRFGKWGGTWWEKPSTAAKTNQIIFPIPKPQLNSNAKLKQNPGYN